MGGGAGSPPQGRGMLLPGTLPECCPLQHLHGVPAKARGTEHAHDYFAILACPLLRSHDVRRELYSVQCWPRARTWPEGCSVSGAMFLQAHMSGHCTIRASEIERETGEAGAE